MQLHSGEKRKWYTTAYFVSLALLVASLPLSKFTMSIFQFTTLLFWLWDGIAKEFSKKNSFRDLLNPTNFLLITGELIKSIFITFGHKLVAFYKNKPALAISSIMLLHVIGLIYTTDFEYAFKDLRTKLPIFILPLFVATGPRISTKVFYQILALFIAAVIGGSLYRLILFLNMSVADSRDIDVHTSHIRYCLNAVFAIFILFYFTFSNGKLNTGQKALAIVAAVWLVLFMAYLNYTTGILIFAIVSFILLVFFTLKIKSIRFRIAGLVAIGILVLLPVYYFISIAYNILYTPPIEFSKLEKYTRNGNSYYHDTLNFKTRNGKWIGLYICEKELRQSWAQRSKFPIDSLDKLKQTTRSTLITYLASKNLRKDANGVNQLLEEDIHNIENGINKVDYGKLPGLNEQMEDFISGYKNYIYLNDPNSSSMIQRFEYWRTSLLIIRQHPLFGVGTGDLPLVFEEEYRNMNSHLAPQYRLRSHNQYLSITVGFGLLGFGWFMLVMFYPGLKTRNFSNYFFVIFWLIFMLSMLTEDTIENQEGVTFFATFTAIMLLGRANILPEESISN